ncbi:hypothetical protein EJB05_57908, partial [Eragrostis curvula]
MHRAAAKLVLLIAAAAAGSLSVVTNARQQHHVPAAGNISASCRPHERDALLTFKRGVTNDTVNRLHSWRPGQDCCRWTGITCSSKTGNVLKLDLGRKYQDPAFVGQISPSLLSLEYLEYLDLSTNFLEGSNSSVPKFLGSMKNLRHLDLSYIPFTGTVPPLFGNLTKLEYLNLSNTSFFGSLPPQFGNLSNLRYLDLSWMQNSYSTDISWLANLQFLEYIDMSNTNLSTVVDFPLAANMIPTLQYIVLVNCSLQSADQSIQHFNLTKLEELDLSRNFLGHSIASCWFWNATSIKTLSLVSTHLGGHFPDALGGMVSLQNLYFNDNGNAVTMTVDLKNLCELKALWLDGSFSSGNITQFVEMLPRCSSNKLFFLSSADNNMTGFLPNVMEHLTGLTFIDLSNNCLTGAIPPEVWNLPILDTLYLSSNQLSGQIPLLPKTITTLDISMNCLSGHLPTKFGAPNLTVLILSSNYITGEVPESICESRDMQLLDLSNNLFEGELPRCSSMQNMLFLYLSNNSFSGVFPSWIQRCSSMVFLDLSWNKLNGTLPRWIGELARLQFLQLSHNMFCGDIPVNITNLGSLQYLNLASNNISGLIPLTWSKLVEMTLKYPVLPWRFDSLFDGRQEDLLSLVMKRHVLRYGPYGIGGMVGIDLSLNYLTGEIPDEITSLNRLSNLNLSWNHLTGQIPEKIGDMKSVESLDLSRNNLSGQIPSSLSDLTYLSSLDLSFNNLTGRIPSGRQLDTLYTEDPSIYDGNSFLCGPPLRRSCSGSNSTESGKKMPRENDPETIIFYVGCGWGFTFGFWAVFCVMLFIKNWRISFYRLLDRAYDRVYVFVVLTWGRLPGQG